MLDKYLQWLDLQIKKEEVLVAHHTKTAGSWIPTPHRQVAYGELRRADAYATRVEAYKKAKATLLEMKADAEAEK